MSSRGFRTSLIDSETPTPSYSTIDRSSSVDLAQDDSKNNPRRMINIASCPESPDLEQLPYQFFRENNRLVSKEGNLKVKSTNVPKKLRLYLREDLFTTMIDMKWHWVILLFCVSYILSWVLFGTIWWLIVLSRGKSVCFTDVDDWTTAFLFSIETQQTIGYGSRTITSKCAEAIITLQVQSIVGDIIDAFMLGLTFAKLSRPRERARTVKFSRYASICLRDGKMCLMFRVGDVRKSQIVEAHIRAQLFRYLETSEGTSMPFYQQDLRLCYDWRNCDRDDNRNHIFLLMPLVVMHIIDERSPLYHITADKLRHTKFEIVIVLDGIVEATGMNTQPKTSYLSQEILWGHDFLQVADQSPFDVQYYASDYSKFDDMKKVAMPDLSPFEYYQQHPLRDENDTSLPNLYI
ncbi:inward rectifier potassium channel 2 isoform X2 [Nematostella vectensis]|nr:inward rectifier potassium channel 2 isoform X2 [Nematostella vectensis]